MTLAELEAAHPGFKAYCREQFVGNECGSDEYRETQPAKGMGMIANWFDQIHPEYPEGEAFEEIEKWVAALAADAGGSYAGADELVPVLARYFDSLWERDLHPYSAVEEIAQYELQWFLEDQAQA